MLLAGFSGIGKTELAKKYKNVIDLDSAPYVYDDSDILDIPFEKRKGRIRKINSEWPLNYINAIREALEKYEYVLVWDREDILEEYIKNGFNFVICYPDKSDLTNYIKRYRDRGNTEEYIKWKLEQYDNRVKFYEKLDVEKIKLKNNKYLEDYFIENSFQLFRKENKYDSNL